MAQTGGFDFAGLEEFLQGDGDAEDDVLMWYERIAEHEMDGSESPEEVDLLYKGAKYLMSFAFTSTEELRNVAEAEAVTMAEKEEAWEEQRAQLKEELEELREQITSKAEIDDSTVAFRAQIDSLKEENRQLQQAGRDRDREMADQRDRFESLVARVESVTRERDALVEHKNHLEDSIREMNRRLSAKSEESSSDWESRKLRQRSEQALTMSRQLQSVIVQNEELRDEVERVSDALEEATRIIEQSTLRYTDVSQELEFSRQRVAELIDQNRRLTEGLPEQIIEKLPKCMAAAEKLFSGASTDKINFLWQMSELLLPNFLTSADFQALQDATGRTLELELQERIRKSDEEIGALQENLAAAVDESNQLRMMIREDRTGEKEEELEHLRHELVAATTLARNLFGEAMLDKPGADPTLTLQMRIFQLEQSADELRNELEAGEKKIGELQFALEQKDVLHSELAADLDRLKQAKFGSARDEIGRLETQLRFRDEQIGKLQQHCTLLHVELGQYVDAGVAPTSRVRQSRQSPTTTRRVTRPAEKPTSTSGKEKEKPRQTEPRKVIPSDVTEESSSTSSASPVAEPKPRISENNKPAKPSESYSELAQQSVLISNLYFELMQLLEELKQKDDLLARMKANVTTGKKSVEELKAQLNLAYGEVKKLKQDNVETVEKALDEAHKSEQVELKRLVESISEGGDDLERRMGETTRKLVVERVERIRLTRQCAILRAKSSRAEWAGRRLRDKMRQREIDDSRRMILLKFQLDTNAIELSRLQNRILQSVPIDEFEQLRRKYKKLVQTTSGVGFVEEVVPRRQAMTVGPPSDAEWAAKEQMLRRMADVQAEQAEFWRREAEMLQEENEQLKKFVEDVENESDARSVLGAVERRLLATIRELRDNDRQHALDTQRRKADRVDAAASGERWRRERVVLLDAVGLLQRENQMLRSQSMGAVGLEQLELLRQKIVETRENEIAVGDARKRLEAANEEAEAEFQRTRALKSALETMKSSESSEHVQQQLQTAFFSAAQLSAKLKTLERSLHLKERQMAELNGELQDVKDYNVELVAALEGFDWLRERGHKASEPETAGSVHGSSQRRPVEPTKADSDVDLDDSQVTSSSDNDSSYQDRVVKVVKTVVQDGSRQFDARIGQLKDSAELAVRGYKEQLAAKELAIEKYKQLLRERLDEEPEVREIRSEVRVVDEDTQRSLRKAHGDVKRLKAEVEELSEANEILHAERRQQRQNQKANDVISVDNTTQTEQRLDDAEAGSRLPSPKTSLPDAAPSDVEPRSPGDVASAQLTEEMKLMREMIAKRDQSDVENQRQKAEIRSLRTRIQRLTLTNKELLSTCEQIREDALAELSTFRRNNENLDERQLVDMRLELNKLRTSNKNLRSANDELHVQVERLQAEVSRNNEKKQIDPNDWERRKKSQEMIANLRKQLADKETQQKQLQEKTSRLEKVLEDLRRDQTTRQLDLEKTQRRLNEMKLQKDDAMKTLESTTRWREKAVAMEEIFKKKEQELAAMTINLRKTQRENSNQQAEMERKLADLRAELQAALRRPAPPPPTTTSTTSERRAVPTSSTATQTTRPRVTISEHESVALALPLSPVSSTTSSSSTSSSKSPTLRFSSSTSTTMVGSERRHDDVDVAELKKKLRITELRLAESQEKLEDMQRDHSRLLDQFQRIVNRSSGAKGEEKLTGSVRVLSDKLEAKDREIMQLKAQIAHLERRVNLPIDKSAA